MYIKKVINNGKKKVNQLHNLPLGRVVMCSVLSTVERKFESYSGSRS